MQNIIYNDYKDLSPLLKRIQFSKKVEKEVEKVMTDIKENGDSAIKRYAQEFDKVTLDSFYVSQSEINESAKLISPELKKALKIVHKNITTFAKQKIPHSWQNSLRDGVTLGEKFTPLDRVGCYIPGGTAPLISTVLHTATLAQVAGVKNIVATTKVDKDNKVHPAILYACQLSGVTEILKLSGIYAIGALAFGTKTIPQVDKIVGPGNAYVTAAKKYSYGYCSLDLIAGPSEIMIIADETANPSFVAADLLSQAEHGSGHEQAVLVSTSNKLIQEVTQQITEQRKTLSRDDKIAIVINKGTFAIKVKNLDEACEIASLYSAEHLEIITKNPEKLVDKIHSAGAIFLGQWTPEPVGDFVAGSSHVLPTGGSGKYFNGLTIEQFFRRTSIIKYNQQALKKEVKTIKIIAKAEGLDAHARSASIRFE